MAEQNSLPMVEPCFGDEMDVAIISLRAKLDRSRASAAVLSQENRNEIIANVVTRAVAESANLHETSTRILQAICENLGWSWGGLWKVDRKAKIMRCVEVWHSPQVSVPEFEAQSKLIGLQPGVDLPGRVWSSASPCWIADVTRDVTFPRRAAAEKEGLHGAFALPIRHANKTLAVIEFFSGKIEEPNEHLLKLLHGITSQLSPFIERGQIEDDLRENEECLRLMAENIQEIFWMSNAEGSRILYVSPSYETIFGLTRQSLYEDARSFLEVVHADDRNKVEAFLAKLPDRIEMEYRIQGKDGTLRWIWVRAYPVKDEHNQVRRLVGVARDMTEHRLLEAQLRQSQKMDAIGQLAGGIAHDFNNLLTIINGYSEILLGMAADDDPRKKALHEIKHAGDRAAALTRQLLAFSRKQLLRAKVLNLNDVIGNIEDMLRRLIGEEIALVTTYDPELDLVKADPGQVEQVVMNLALNAHDAMPRGGRLEIATRNDELDEDYCRRRPGCKPGSYATIALTDTGCGMPPDVKARIFEPFFTTKDFGKGTGLGLATVYGIVKQSEGYIDVDSEVGVGTTVKVHLPVAPAIAIPADSKQGVVVSPPGNERILVVEDEDSLRELIRITLEGQGYEVLTAHDGREAGSIATTRAHSFHLVITDVVMPEMSGRKLVESLCLRYPGIKVLFISGYTSDSLVRHGIKDSTYAFLQKPFSMSVLGTKVREILDEKR